MRTENLKYRTTGITNSSTSLIDDCSVCKLYGESILLSPCYNLRHLNGSLAIATDCKIDGSMWATPVERLPKIKILIILFYGKYVPIPSITCWIGQGNSQGNVDWWWSIIIHFSNNNVGWYSTIVLLRNVSEPFVSPLYTPWILKEPMTLVIPN